MHTIQISLEVHASDIRALSGTKIKTLAEAAGIVVDMYTSDQPDG
jgi:hypothetical protein